MRLLHRLRQAVDPPFWPPLVCIGAPCYRVAVAGVDVADDARALRDWDGGEEGTVERANRGDERKDSVSFRTKGAER